jgi:hypothetical protein
LKVTATISVVEAGAVMQQAMDVSTGMAPAPIDPAVQLSPGPSVVVATASQSDFRSVLERLDGFMKVANLAAEVCQCHVAVVDGELKT